MAVTVVGPNGGAIQFPDDTPPETIDRVMRQHFADSQPKEEAAPKVENPTDMPPVDSRNSFGNVTRSILNGATFGMGDEAMAHLRALTDSENRPYSHFLANERASKEAFGQEHPISSTLGNVAGAASTAFLPVGGLSELGVAGKALKAALPVVDTGRVGGEGVGLVRGLNEAGMLGAKSNLYQSFGDADGSFSDRMKTVADNAKRNAVTGYAMGAPFGLLARGVGGGVEDAARYVDAKRSGFNAPEMAALKNVYDTIDRAGNTTNDVISGMVDRTAFRNGRFVTPDQMATMVKARGDALAKGLSDSEADNAAIEAYRRLNPTTRTGTPLTSGHAMSRARGALDAWKSNFSGSGPDMTAVENLSGANRPLTGDLKTTSQYILNSPGPGREVVRDVLDPRQQEAVNRTRKLITDTIGPTDYVQQIHDLEDASKKANSAAYDIARKNAQPFDLNDVFQKHNDIANTLGGDTAETVRQQGQKMLDWWTRAQTHFKDDPAAMLNGYKQARTSLTQKIESLRNHGPFNPGADPSAAMYLRDLKGDMDAKVKAANPDWWTANQRASTAKDIRRAADMGRELPLREGAAVQEAKYWHDNDATDPEKMAFRYGLARAMHDRNTNVAGLSDVSRHLLTGDEVDNEGMRGLLSTVLGKEDSAKFLSQLEKERTALSTSRLDKGSQTFPMTASGKLRNVASKLMSISKITHPWSLLPSIAEHVAQNTTSAINNAQAKMLFSTGEQPFLRLMRGLDVAARPPKKFTGAFSKYVPSSAAFSAPYAFQKKKDR